MQTNHTITYHTPGAHGTLYTLHWSGDNNPRLAANVWGETLLDFVTIAGGEEESDDLEEYGSEIFTYDE